MVKKREQAIKSATELADSIVRLDSQMVNNKTLDMNDESLTPLEIALKRISIKFLSFLPYIPQSVVAASRESFEIDSIINNTKLKYPITKYGKKSRNKISNKSETSDSQITPKGDKLHPNKKNSNATSNTGRSHNRLDGRNSTQVATKNSFVYKDIAVLLIDIVDIHNLLEGFSSIDIIEVHEELMSQIYEIVNLHRGVVEIIQDKFIVTYNAATSSVGPEKEACATAIAIANSIETKLLPEWKKHELPPLLVNMAIVSGPAFVGGIGNQYVKSFVTLSPILTKLWKLVKLNHNYTTDHRILIDDSTAKKIDLQFTTKIIDVIELGYIPSQNKPELLYSLVTNTILNQTNGCMNTQN